MGEEAEHRPAQPDLPTCCPHYHEAVEMLGRRWTGAIVAVLLERGAPMRFTEVSAAVPELSDRLLSERMKELERRGVVRRHVDPGPPVRVRYELTAAGRGLRPAVKALERWAQRWLAPGTAVAPSDRAQRARDGDARDREGGRDREPVPVRVRAAR
jgi:DNA-binding HxlR family transcriptional regulator